MKRFALLILIALFCLPLSALADEPIYLFPEPDGSPGKIHPLSLEDLNPHPLDTFWYTESYFFIAILDDGHIAYVNLMLSNMGLKKHQPALTFTIITPELERFTTEAEYAPEDIEQTGERFSLRMGENLLEGDSRDMHLKLLHQGLGMDLKFHGSFAGYKLGEGKVYFGKDRATLFYIDYPAPRPHVTGTLTIHDRRLEVQGWGYVDHCYYNANTMDFEDVWHNFKFYSDRYSVILTSFTTPERFGGQSVSLGAILDNEKVLCTTTDVIVIEKDHRLVQDGGKSYPHTLELDFKCPGLRAKTCFDSSHVVEKIDVLEKLNKGAATRALKFLINTFITRPFYYRAENQAVVELTADGKTEKISGQAVSEVIFVR